MKYIAFDIGTKNLAYCIINSDNYEFNWDSFTFSSDPYESETDGSSQFFMAFYINECIIDKN